MKPKLKHWCLTVFAVLGMLAVSSQFTLVAQSQPSRPVGFADQIAALLESDKTSPPPQNGILLIGSSIFRQWANLKDQMAPLPVFNRAFGGSRTWEVLHYMDQVVLPYHPRVIVYYTGSNDVNAGESASAIVSRIKEFVNRAHAALPATRVYFVAINKSPDKRARWNVVDAVNAEMLSAAATTPHLRYLDLNPVLFDIHGEPRAELYRPDGLHFFPPAYDAFTAIIKPVLIDAWQQLGAQESGQTSSLTPAQIKESESLAAKYNQMPAREMVRLERFKNRPLGAVIQRSFDVMAGYLMMASEMVPESGYSFRPTADLRTFGGQISHAAVSNYSFCNQAGVPPGVQHKPAPDLSSLTSKSAIVKALKDSVAYCDGILAEAPEAWLMEIAPKVGGSSSGLVEGMRAHAFMYNNVHDSEDYGTITIYLRMLGLVPPSTAVHVISH